MYLRSPLRPASVIVKFFEQLGLKIRPENLARSLGPRNGESAVAQARANLKVTSEQERTTAREVIPNQRGLQILIDTRSYSRFSLTP